MIQRSQPVQIDNFKPVSNFNLSQLGIKPVMMQHHETLEDLKKYGFGIVIGECVNNLEFSQNNFKIQTIKKKNHYVMSLGTYQQLHINPFNQIQKILKPSNFKFNKIYRPYSGQDLNNKTLLIWRTGGIGDLLFIQPNLIYLKEKYPTCKIKFACAPMYQPMVNNWECVDELLDLPFNIKYLLESDYHIIFEGVIERTKEGEKTNAYNLFTKWMGLNLPDELLIPKLNIKEDKLIEVKEILKNWNISNFIVIQMRASSPIRVPRPSIWKNIIIKLIQDGHNVVITDSPHKAQEIDNFIDSFELEYQDRIFNFSTYSKTLDLSIALTSMAKLAISTDSSLMHIGAALNIPILGLFGPFPGEIRLTTYKNCDWINVQSPCSPCFIHSPKLCNYAVKNHVSCYDNLNIDEFIEKSKKLIQKKDDKNNA